jgi:hypothetical protein
MLDLLAGYARYGWWLCCLRSLVVLDMLAGGAGFAG